MGEKTSERLQDWAATERDGRLYFNATAVSCEGRGLLFCGPSGCGKSAIALALMAYSAQLISDDGVWVDGTELVRPETAPLLIEARGIGLLNTGPVCARAPLAYVIDLSGPASDRLPPRRFVATGAHRFELIQTAYTATLAPALLQLVRQGRSEP